MFNPGSVIKLLQSKISIIFSCGAISLSDEVFSDFPQTFSSMLHVRFSLLWRAQRSQNTVVLAFPKIFTFEPGSSIKLLSAKIEKMFPQCMV